MKGFYHRHTDLENAFGVTIPSKESLGNQHLHLQRRCKYEIFFLPFLQHSSALNQWGLSVKHLISTEEDPILVRGSRECKILLLFTQQVICSQTSIFTGSNSKETDKKKVSREISQFTFWQLDFWLISRNLDFFCSARPMLTH